MIIEIRKNLKSVGWLWYFIAAMFIVPPFINAIRMFNAKLDSAATVNGLPIKFKEFRRIKQSHENYIKQLAAVGLGQFAKPMSDADVLRSCAQTTLEEELADKVGVDIGGEQLAEEVSKGLAKHSKSKDGQLDFKRYTHSVMASAGMSVAEYEHSIETGMRTDALHELVRASSYKPQFFASKEAGELGKDKKFNIVSLPLSKFVSQVEKEDISDEQLELFHRENASRYMTTQEREVSYALLDRDLFAEMAIPDAGEIEEYYQRYMSEKFSEPEQFSISYAVAEFDGDEAKEELTKALEEVAQTVASSSKKLSQVSPKNKSIKLETKKMISLGRGELPYLLEAEIGEHREVGAVTKVVEATGKLYLAQVTEHKPFSIKPLESVEAEIVKTLKKSKIDDLIRDEIEAMILEVREMDNGQEVFDRVVQRLGLKTKKAGFSQDDKPKGALEAQVHTTAFNPNVYEGHLGYVSAKEDGMAIFLVTSLTPAKLKPLDDVRGQVQKDFVSRQARFAQEAKSEKLRQALLSGQSLEGELEDLKLKINVSEWVSKGEKDIKGYNFGAKLISTLMTMDRPEQVYRHQDDETIYLIWLNEKRQKDEKSEKLDDEFAYSRDTVDGFVAGLLKNAKIIPNKGMIADLLPEF